MKIIRGSCLLLIMTFLSSCGTVPPIDTFNKRVAVFEIAYNQILINIKQYVNEGKLIGDDKKHVLDNVKKMADMRFKMNQAIIAKDMLLAEDRLTNANTLLSLLRAYIETREGRPPP